MSKPETVTQRVYRRRRETALRSHQIVKRGRVVGSLLPRESHPVRSHELGCLVQGLLVAAPLVIDAILWYTAFNGHPEIAGLAFIGAPIAFMASFVLANSN